MIAGLEKKKRLISPHEKKIVAFHEAGHAVVGHMLGSADAVQKISIVPRGVAALGYTIQLPTEDRYLVTKKVLEQKLASLLGQLVTLPGPVTTATGLLTTRLALLVTAAPQAPLTTTL